MSFALDDNEEAASTDGADQKVKADDATSLGGGGSGVAGPSGGGQNPGAAPEGGAKPSSSGSWTNLQSYLDANKDQATDVGNAVAGNVSKQATQAQQDTQSAASDFKNAVDAGTVNYDSGSVNQAITDAGNLKSGQDLSQDDYSNFGKASNAAYTGPTDITKDSGYSKAAGEVGNASTALDQTKSEAGRDVLLGNTYQNASQNGYNTGERNLDQLLLEGNPQNQQMFSGLNNQFSGIQQALTDATTQSQAQALAGQNTTDATKKSAQDALGSANTSLQGTLANQLSSAQSGGTAAYNKAVSDLKNGSITADEAKALGLTEGERTYGADLSSLMNPAAPTATTAYNTATADQYAQAAALAKLAGNQTSDYLPSNMASQAGTNLPYTFDQNQATSAISAAQKTYTDALNSPVPGWNFLGKPGTYAQAQDLLAQEAQNPGTWGAPYVQAAQAAMDQFSTYHPLGQISIQGATPLPSVPVNGGRLNGPTPITTPTPGPGAPIRISRGRPTSYI